MNLKKHPLLTYFSIVGVVLLCLPIPFVKGQRQHRVNKLFHITDSNNLLDDTQRKFDYFFYEAIKAKLAGRYDEAFDFFQYCFEMDSTNANVLVELASFYNVLQHKDKAIDFLEKAVQHDSTNYYYSMQLAELSKEMGDREKVIDIYTYLSQLYPDKTELSFDLAMAYADNGDLQKAIDKLNELEKTFGISESITINKFRLYSMLNKKDEAINEIQHIIDKNPNDIRYLLLMGDIYVMDNQPEKALPYYDKAGKINPDFPSFILSMVNYYEKTGDKPAAEQELQKAITNTSLDVETKIQMLTRYIAILQQNQHEIKTANPLFEKLFSQHPNNTQLNLLYGNVLLLQENKQEAEKQFRIFIDANPDNPVGYEQIIRIALPDNLDKVIEITDKAIKKIPKLPQFYFYNGGAKFQQGKIKEALKVFQEGIENAEIENPLVESDFYGQIGDLHHALGDNKKAYENYEKALSLNPQNLPVLNNYSYYLSLEKRDLEKAEQMSSITIKAEPTNATYLDTYGWVLFEKGAYSTAKIYIEQAVEYGKEEPSAEVYDHYGNVLYKTGEIDKAVEQWKRAKELGSDSPVLDKKIKEKKYIEK